MVKDQAIDPAVPPSGIGCVECLELGGWWLHLRRCAQCGHVGCCDSSLGQHASAHAGAQAHPVVRSFEPGENWYWDYGTGEYVDGTAELAGPPSRPSSQSAPGPAGSVPPDWRSQLH